MKTLFAAIMLLICGWMRVEGQYWRPEISLGVGGMGTFGKGSYGSISGGGGIHYHFSPRSSLGVVFQRIFPSFSLYSRAPHNFELWNRTFSNFSTGARYYNSNFFRIEGIYRYHFSDAKWMELGIGRGTWLESFFAIRQGGGSSPYVNPINYNSPNLDYPVVNLSTKFGFMLGNIERKLGMVSKIGGEFWIFLPDYSKYLTVDLNRIYLNFRPTHGVYFMLTAEFGFGGKF